MPKVSSALAARASSPVPAADSFARLPAVATDAASALHPDVLNSVALPIEHSPLDERWNRVAATGVIGRAATFVAGLHGTGERNGTEPPTPTSMPASPSP